MQFRGFDLRKGPQYVSDKHAPLRLVSALLGLMYLYPCNEKVIAKVLHLLRYLYLVAYFLYIHITLQLYTPGTNRYPRKRYLSMFAFWTVYVPIRMLAQKYARFWMWADKSTRNTSSRSPTSLEKSCC